MASKWLGKVKWIVTAYKKGQAAKEAGLPLSACPYDELKISCAKFREAWIAGWKGE